MPQAQTADQPKAPEEELQDIKSSKTPKKENKSKSTNSLFLTSLLSFKKKKKQIKVHLISAMEAVQSMCSSKGMVFTLNLISGVQFSNDETHIFYIRFLLIYSVSRERNTRI